MDYHNDFVVPCLTGQMDEYLDGMIQTIQMRKKDMAPKVWEFQVGDRVRMKNANPKYLNGAMATVKKINRTKVVIDLDTPAGRFSRNITTPLGMLEKI
jgi:transglutaminase/protease-like cytokinesis protein 3